MEKDKIKKKTEEKTEKKNGKILTGIVLSDKMKDTCVVKVERFVKHKKYKKYYKSSKNYKAHDIGNTKKIGEKVLIKEIKPISKGKHFTVVN